MLLGFLPWSQFEYYNLFPPSEEEVLEEAEEIPYFAFNRTAIQTILSAFDSNEFTLIIQYKEKGAWLELQ